MGIFSSIFGGGTSKASEESLATTQQDNRARQAEINRATLQARGDVQRIFPEALDVSQQGFQGALGILGQGIPAEIQAFQQGNVGAQQITADTLPLIRAALLGLPTDFSALQPQTINADTSFLQNVQGPVANNPFAVPAGGQTSLNDIANLFSGGGQPSNDRRGSIFQTTPATSRPPISPDQIAEPAGDIFDPTSFGDTSITPQVQAVNDFINNNIGNFQTVSSDFDDLQHFNTTPNLPIGGNITNPFVLNKIAEQAAAVPQVASLPQAVSLPQAPTPIEAILQSLEPKQDIFDPASFIQQLTVAPQLQTTPPALTRIALGLSGGGGGGFSTGNPF